MNQGNVPLNFPQHPLVSSRSRAASKTPRKPSFPISDSLRYYLSSFGREVPLPVSYRALEHFQAAAPLYDADGNDTLWETVIYHPENMQRMAKGLKEVYAILRMGGDTSHLDHLYVDRVDYCSFGNSRPFRIRIVNAHNDNQDYYYIKKADASRIYGLELEHLLSPNRMYFMTQRNTLVEEHIVGLPGDMFIDNWLHNKQLKAIRIAKELIKFNERCFVRLLGDMRPYNFIVDITPDFEETQIRIRAMDFDQQSYDGRKNFYLPQFFKQNYPLVEFCTQRINTKTAAQYQREEHAVIVRRMEAINLRLKALLRAMAADDLAPREHVLQLREELAAHYGNDAFKRCESMGALVKQSLDQVRQKALART